MMTKIDDTHSLSYDIKLLKGAGRVTVKVNLQGGNDVGGDDEGVR
jgi:hypothetical protein